MQSWRKTELYQKWLWEWEEGPWISVVIEKCKNVSREQSTFCRKMMLDGSCFSETGTMMWYHSFDTPTDKKICHPINYFVDYALYFHLTTRLPLTLFCLVLNKSYLILTTFSCRFWVSLPFWHQFLLLVWVIKNHHLGQRHEHECWLESSDRFDLRFSGCWLWLCCVPALISNRSKIVSLDVARLAWMECERDKTWP